jgi:hypothetical protein
MEFERMVEKTIKDKVILKEIELLLIRKKSGAEMGEEPRIEILQNYIQKELEYFKEFLRKEMVIKPVENEKLNMLFRTTLQEAWTAEK